MDSLDQTILEIKERGRRTEEAGAYLDVSVTMAYLPIYVITFYENEFIRTEIRRKVIKGILQ